jgi:hypothetical protein
MGRPIIVDDGGSIRIKLALKDPDSAGVMDSLFDLANRQSEHERTSPAQDPYSKALILCLDEDGNLSPPNPVPSPFKRIKIIGDSSIDVEITKNPPGTKLNLKLIGNGIDPEIGSKQHNKKRSYVVSNAGRIVGIELEDNNGNTAPVSLPLNGLFTSVIIT